MYNPATPRNMESRNVIIIELPSRLFPPSVDETSQQIIPPSNEMDGHKYITDADFVRNLSDYTSVLEPLPTDSAEHIAMGGFSENPPVGECLERIDEITRRDTPEGDATGPLQVGAMPGGEPTDGVAQEGVLQPQKQPGSPAVTSVETPLPGSQSLEQGGIYLQK